MKEKQCAMIQCLYEGHGLHGANCLATCKGHAKVLQLVQKLITIAVQARDSVERISMDEPSANQRRLLASLGAASYHYPPRLMQLYHFI